MPAASSGPYQSRIFNFVHQQSRRVSRQLSSTFRHLRVATSWGVQAILYPIYLLFQSTESSGKQLYSSRQKNWLQPPADEIDVQPQTPPAADQAIQRVLSLVNASPQEEDGGTGDRGQGKTIHKGWNLYFFFKRIFRYASPGEESISSQIVLQKAELVPKTSFPFSPPAPERASPLPPIPRGDHASSLKRGNPATGLAPEPPPALFPPPALSVRGIATQLSTRTLVLVTAQNEILDILTSQQQQKLQERIIGEVADYWGHWRLADSSRQRLTTQPLPTGQTEFFAPVRCLQRLMSWVQKEELTHPSSFMLDPDQALAVVDRTVANLELRHLEPMSEVAIALVRRSRELVLALPSWLTASSSHDLVDGNQPPEIASGTETYRLRIQALIWAAINYFFGDRAQSQLEQTVPTSIMGDLPGPQPKLLQHRAQGVSDDADSWLTLSELFGRTQLAPAPEWIETHATAMGYVKHPLEQLLGWLDRALLWLEELLLKVVQWVQQKTAR